MRLATGNHLTAHGDDKSTPPFNACKTNETENRTLSENNSLQSQDHLQLVARATNDAVRAWDVRTGTPVWPQGLASLLCYCRSSIPTPSGVWHQHIHPEQAALSIADIGAAPAGT